MRINCCHPPLGSVRCQDCPFTTPVYNTGLIVNGPVFTEEDKRALDRYGIEAPETETI